MLKQKVRSVASVPSGRASNDTWKQLSDHAGDKRTRRPIRDRVRENQTRADYATDVDVDHVEGVTLL